MFLRFCQSDLKGSLGFALRRSVWNFFPGVIGVGTVLEVRFLGKRALVRLAPFRANESEKFVFKYLKKSHNLKF
jgi:hypothetical protein